MSASHPHGHNGGGLSPEEQRKIWDHVRAIEVLEEQMDEVRLDIKMRKELVKADGFDTNIVAAIVKRRKAGEGETRAADSLIRMYEDGLREQGALPLEQTRAAAPQRSTVEVIADRLHGLAAPEMPEKNRGGEDRTDEQQYLDARKLVVEADKASTSWLQRQLQIGYNAAAKLIERMEAEGVVSRADATGRRVVLQNVDTRLSEQQQKIHDEFADAVQDAREQFAATQNGGMFDD